MAFEQNRALQQLINPQMQNNQMMQNNQFQPSQTNFNPVQQGGNGWLSWFKRLFAGSPDLQGSSTNFTPFQQQGFQGLQNAGQYNMQNPYEGYDEFQNGILSQYNQQVVPQILSRLGNSALSSPDLAKHFQLGGQGLASQLLQHKLNYGQNNRQFGLQQTQLGLTPQYQQNYIPGQPGLLQNLLPIAGNVAGARYFGGQ